MKKVIDRLLQNDTDVILTRRNATYYQKTDFYRKHISKLLKLAIKTLIRIDFSDSQAGLKAFNKTGKQTFLSTKINRYLFDLEFSKTVIKKQYKYKIVEIDLRKGVELSNFNLKILISEFFDFLKIIFG